MRVLFSLVVCLVVTMVGCNANHQERTTNPTSETRLAVVGGSELESYLQASESPVLVEFGVDFNCPRCAQTKGDVVRLCQTLEGDVDVIRVDFNANAKMVAQLGGTVCPTYVLFDQGAPVMTRSFPLSIELLEGEILRVIEK